MLHFTDTIQPKAARIFSLDNEAVNDLHIGYVTMTNGHVNTMRENLNYSAARYVDIDALLGYWLPQIVAPYKVWATRKAARAAASETTDRKVYRVTYAVVLGEVFWYGIEKA